MPDAARKETYETVRDVLDRIRNRKRTLRDQLEQIRQSTADPRSRFLLDSFRRAEQESNLAIGQYQRDGGSKVLETWLQYAPLEETVKTLEKTEFTPEMDPDEIRSRKAEFDQALIQFYRQLARQTSVPEVTELFSNLADQTEELAKKQSWQAADSDLAPGV